MYPECVIASRDAFIFLLDAENIERRVQLDTEKKIKSLCKLQTPGKKQRHMICKFVFRENNFYQLIGSHQSAVEAKLLCQTMRTTMKKVVATLWRDDRVPQISR